MDIYFTDYFHISPITLEDYGAFNVSLINDLPLFIDPFLLFNSSKPEYQKLHESILRYMRFLRDKSVDSDLQTGFMGAWYLFPEIKQNWLGFSMVGNKGAGLNIDFANALHNNLHAIFHNFGSEKVTHGSHIEKLCLIKDGVGRDKISDFTTNLIKEFIVNYTQTFAQTCVDPQFRRRVVVSRVRFSYATETWESGVFDLPFYNDDYVLLTPTDMLTKDETWINKPDLYSNFERIPLSIPNEVLRAQIDNYFRSVLPENPDQKDRQAAVNLVISKFPEVLDYYIRTKEDEGDLATSTSAARVTTAKKQYVEQISELAEILRSRSGFYANNGDTYEQALQRVHFLKDVIENKDGYKLFYIDGKPIERELDLQILFRLTWFATDADVNREVNNGRGPVDFKIAKGRRDATLVEFKLAKNSQLKKNLQNQVPIYEKASDTRRSIKVILYFSHTEFLRATDILKDLKKENEPNIIFIDARNDNKPSASKA